MFNFNDVSLERLVIHHIGNHTQGGELVLSEKELQIEDETVKDLLMRYFLSSFKSEAKFHFEPREDEGFKDHELYGHSSKIFANPETLYDTSTLIAERLYDESSHPHIRTGDLYVAYFSNCYVDNEVVDAIGIFKSESKETFLKVYQEGTKFDLGYEQGIDIKKLDKGCLIFDVEAEVGYKVAIVDKINKNEEALYWKQHFLNLCPREDSYFYTKNYMQLCKDFVVDVFNEEHNVDRSEQIEMLNRSAKFFETHETFTTPDFEDEVMVEPTVMDAFKEYKQEYIADRDLPLLVEEFDISPPAVKSNKKIFKSILKLDKNFSVYVHGNRDFMEKGYDEERELGFYKLYFREEK